MYIKQLSIFLENRAGRLGDVLTVLKNNEINIVSASLADTSEFGLLRLLVNDTAKAKSVLKQAGFTAKDHDIIALVIPHKIGSLVEITKLIDKAGINIEYMYGLSTGIQGASIAIKTSDLPGTVKALEPLNPKYYTEKEISEVGENSAVQ